MPPSPPRIWTSTTRVSDGRFPSAVGPLLTGSAASIRGVAKTIAAGAMSYYPGDADKFVDLPPPHYWWQAGALMGSMLDYSHYTGDRSYDGVIARALLEQVGPNFDYMRPSHFGQEGNDDQAFWSFSVLAAAERNFSQPDEARAVVAAAGREPVELARVEVEHERLRRRLRRRHGPRRADVRPRDHPGPARPPVPPPARGRRDRGRPHVCRLVVNSLAGSSARLVHSAVYNFSASLPAKIDGRGHLHLQVEM